MVGGVYPLTLNWLPTFSYVWLIVSGISFLVVLFDVPKQHQPMEIMKVVWPLTTLYMGPIGLYGHIGGGDEFPSHIQLIQITC